MADKATKHEIETHWSMYDLYQCVYLLDHSYIEQCKQQEAMKNGNR